MPVPPAFRTEAVHRPPAQDVVLLGVGVAGVATSGPIIAATPAPPLVIAFWRNALATGVLLPYALIKHRGEFGALNRRQWFLATTAGICLGLHFGTWTPSLKMTSVASATAFACIQPVWAALIAKLLGHHVPRRAWLGISVAIAGAVLLSGLDLTLSARAFSGDLLAVLAGALAAVYMTLGGVVRQTVAMAVYTVICYSVASAVLAIGAGLFGQPIIGFKASAWWGMAALTLGAQLLGHTVFNRVLKSTSATVVSTAILLEIPGAAVIAAIWLHQVPKPAAVPAVLLILVGLALVVTGGKRGTRHLSNDVTGG